MSIVSVCVLVFAHYRAYRYIYSAPSYLMRLDDDDDDDGFVMKILTIYNSRDLSQILNH